MWPVPQVGSGTGSNAGRGIRSESRRFQETSCRSQPGGSLGRPIRASRPRCCRSRDLRWRPSMISMRLPLRAAKSRLAFPTQDVVTRTPLAAFLSSMTPASAGDLMAREVGQGELLQTVVQDGRDGPGTVQGYGGDVTDEGGDVMADELGGAELLLEDFAGVLAVVTPGLVFTQATLDLLIDARSEGLADGSGPQGEQVAGTAGPVLSLADLLDGGQVAVVALED